MNIVYPIKKYSLYLWDIGINNIIIREKIKKLYNNIFICSDFHSKNIFFANYTLENYEEIHNKIINKYFIYEFPMRINLISVAPSHSVHG